MYLLLIHDAKSGKWTDKQPHSSAPDCLTDIDDIRQHNEAR
jgi:hypothetical protein